MDPSSAIMFGGRSPKHEQEVSDERSMSRCGVHGDRGGVARAGGSGEWRASPKRPLRTTERPPAPLWGDPDLQGDWSFATIYALERPARFSGRELLTEEEIAALNQGALTRGDEPPPPGDPGALD